MTEKQRLVAQKCEACSADAPTATEAEIREFMGELDDDWRLEMLGEMLTLVKDYTFKGYPKAVAAAQEVADLAEDLKHHPAILLEYGKVQVRWWTHKIGGLHRNDFVAAAHTDERLKSHL